MKLLKLLPALLLVSFAFAQKDEQGGDSGGEKPNNGYELNSVSGPHSGAGQRGGGFTEDFESYPVGSPFTPNGGWTSDWDANTEILGSGITGQSARHNSDGSVFAGFELNSPIFTVGHQRINMDVIIGDNTAIYHIVPADSVSGFFNTRIQFELDGTITALQTGDCVSGAFQPTTGTWTPGTLMQIGVEVFSDGTVVVYKDNTVIFTGSDIAAQCAGANGMDNFQIFAANETATNSLTIDNIFIGTPISIPTMGEWGLILFVVLMLGASIAIRRKSASV